MTADSAARAVSVISSSAWTVRPAIHLRTDVRYLGCPPALRRHLTIGPNSLPVPDLPGLPTGEWLLSPDPHRSTRQEKGNERAARVPVPVEGRPRTA